MSKEIGIMQGRLSPDLNGNFQFFPEDWAKEFSVAKQMGFSSIEWLWDWRDWEENPILSADGTDAISSIIRSTNMPVRSLCADYYMKHALFGDDSGESIRYLERIIHNSKKIGIGSIVLPFLEELAIRGEDVKAEIVNNLRKVASIAEESNVKINFETEMSCEEISKFLTSLDSKNFGVCYDLGNAVSYGFDPVADIEKLGKKIGEVHLKDRKKGSTQSVLLGQGDVDFKSCLAALRKSQPGCPIILQAWRGEDYLKDAEAQLNFIKND